jgi:hypothetical protein
MTILSGPSWAGPALWRAVGERRICGKLSPEKQAIGPVEKNAAR